MYDQEVRHAAINALRDGESLRALSGRIGISRSTLRSWRAHPEPSARVSGCPICSTADFPPQREYVYLLGMYLGDGCVSAAARTTALRIACANDWPGVMDECERAMHLVSTRPVYRVAAIGCTQLTTLWKHWPCLFPQHGPGKKHLRRIALAAWQRDLVNADPKPLIRGLLHSDGCRSWNTVHRPLPSGTRTYAYPRYLFSNVSTDIQTIFTDALDLLEIPWRRNRWNSISVARRDAVAALDVFVGPKT
jgi:hypothetical protein